MISVEALVCHTVPVYFSQGEMGDTPNRSDVLALPAFKRRLEQKELRGHYTAHAQMSSEGCKTRPFRVPIKCSNTRELLTNHLIVQV